MQRSLSILALAVAVAFGGCNTADKRIQEHATEFATLDASTQQKIRRGVVEPGYTMDMVYMALGRPGLISSDTAGNTIWTYRQDPVTPANETIQNGYRRRVVYDPEKRSNEIIVEPIDEKAFPNLVPHSLRLTFREGKLVSVDRINRV